MCGFRLRRKNKNFIIRGHILLCEGTVVVQNQNTAYARLLCRQKQRKAKRVAISTGKRAHIYVLKGTKRINKKEISVTVTSCANVCKNTCGRQAPRWWITNFRNIFTPAVGRDQRGMYRVNSFCFCLWSVERYQVVSSVLE